MLLFIDLVLHRPQVYRHLLFNRIPYREHGIDVRWALTHPPHAKDMPALTCLETGRCASDDARCRADSSSSGCYGCSSTSVRTDAPSSLATAR